MAVQLLDVEVTGTPETAVHMSDIDPYEIEESAFIQLIKNLGLPEQTGYPSLISYLNLKYKNNITEYKEIEKIIINSGFSVITEVGPKSFVKGIAFSYEHSSPRFYGEQ
ncbi:MAG: hypothetical protein ABI721_00755 [Candidatus Dojkabacteria bacterium]